MPIGKLSGLTKSVLFCFFSGDSDTVTYRYEKDSAEKQIIPPKECYHFRYFKSILVFPGFRQFSTMQPYLVIAGSALHSDPTGCFHQQMLHYSSTPVSSIF